MNVRVRLGALSAACGAEILRIARTPVDFLLLTLTPAVLLGAMAAMMWGGSPHDLKVVIVDEDGGPLAHRLTHDIAASRTVRIVWRTPSVPQAMSLIRSEQAVAAMVIPRGIGTRVAQGAPVQIHYEAAFLTTGMLASTALRGIATQTLTSAAAEQSGARGLTALRLSLPALQVTLLGNPSASLEWYLGLLIGPAVMHLLIAVTCVGSIGLLLQDKSFAAFVAAAQNPASILIGRLAPHVVTGVVWTTLWLLWLMLARGYRMDGSLLLTLSGVLLLYLATAATALLLVAITRETSSALSGAVIVTGSALAYSGTSLPIAGAGLFARVWSNVLPLSHYLALQMDQVLGVSTLSWAREAGALVLYPVVAGSSAIWLIVRPGRRA